MKLTDGEFHELERLARLELDPEERDRLRLQLGRILGFVRRLQEFETGSSPASEKAGRKQSSAAPDEERGCLDRAEVLDQAPDREGGFFRVPKVIDREGGGDS